MKRKVAAFLCVLAVCFFGCDRASTGGGGPSDPPASGVGAHSSSAVEETAPDGGEDTVPGEDAPEMADPTVPQGTQDGLHPYLEELVQRIVSEISTPEMSEYERAKTAFDYMIEHTVLDEPIGLELWRVHGGGEEPIPYLQQRALSPLRFGVGMCEDYAAALTLLLRGMGLEAEYVPGLTYSVEGHLVDHAWTAVQIDGVWYHLDSQLEDNISRHGAVRYRYFLRGDATLSGSHRWGQNLIDAGLLNAQQNAEIAQHYLTPACPQDYPSPERHTFEEGPAPDLEALRREAEAEIAAYEAEHGPLPEMELNTTPPVFGLEGYGPANEDEPCGRPCARPGGVAAEAEIAAFEAEHGPLPEMELNTTPPVFGLEGYGPANEG